MTEEDRDTQNLTHIRPATEADLPEFERLYATMVPGRGWYCDFKANVDGAIVLTNDCGAVIAAMVSTPVRVSQGFLLVDPSYASTSEGWEQVRGFIVEFCRTRNSEMLDGVMLMLPPALSKSIDEKLRSELEMVPQKEWSLRLASFLRQTASTTLKSKQPN